jgi:hypothetical protein
MLNAARFTIPLRKGLWSNCASISVQLEIIIAKEKYQQCAVEMVYGTSPKWIGTLGEKAIIARHSDKKIRRNLAERGNTVMFVGYSNIHENDVYQFRHIATKKTMFSRDVIWLNKTCSHHMGISQVDFISSAIEDANVEEDKVYELEGEGQVGPPHAITEDHVEQLMDVPESYH